MPTGRFPVRNIEGYMPSVDARSTNKTHIVAGRNFLWDSLGPKSGFGALQMTPFPMSATRDIHGVRAQGRSFVFTQDAILSWRLTHPQGWEIHATFDTEVSNDQRFPWQVIYLNGKLYLSHPARGFFSGEVESSETLWLHPETAATIPGLPPGIKGMAVVRGRAILVNDTQITWSNTGDLSDLTPTEEGAGFQVIAGIVKGTYIALTAFNDGFIVWTTEGAVLAQFTGDELTWRFDPFVSQERPISAWTTVELTTGGSAFLSRRGLFVTGNAESPQAWVPQFNEFFREYTKNKESLDRYFFRIEYDAYAETIYVMESQDLLTYSVAFVMSPTLDRFGLFDVDTYGMLPMTNDRFGYVGRDNIAMYFADMFGREIEPDNALGLDRHYPRVQKQLNIPSSTMVSRAVSYILTAPSTPSYLPRAGWFEQGSFVPYSPVLGGMDSYLELGYLRPDELNMSADTYTEIQEIVLGGIPVAAPLPIDFTTRWNKNRFYRPAEDWDTELEIVHGDLLEDMMIGDDAVDYLVGPDSGHEDYLYMDFPTIIQPPTPTEDWNDDGESEDWNDSTSGLPALEYGIAVRSSQDGITFEQPPIKMAQFNTQSQEWSVIASGTYNVIRLEATEFGEYYHVRALDLTVAYGGQP